MKLEHLHEFVTLAESENFQQTAMDFYISESVLSKHIKGIEQEMGVLLFDRRSRKLFLNKYGRAFLPFAQEIIGQYQSSQAHLTKLLREEGAQLHVGMEAHTSSYGVYSSIAKFKQCYPDIDVIMHEGKHYELSKLIQSGECELIFTTSPLAFPEYKRELYVKDHLVIAVSKDHALANEEFITVEQINKERIIVHEPQFDYDPFWHLCQIKEFVPRIHARIYFHSAIVKLVEISDGITVMGGAHAKEHASANIAALPLYPEIPFNVYMIYDDNYKLSPNAEKLRDFVANETERG